MKENQKRPPFKKKENKKQSVRDLSVFFLAAILLLTLFIYSKSIQNDFVTWDDPEYVTDNALIKDFSIHGVKNLFTSFYEGNYHPLTALSNAVEFHFWKANPKPYHIINLLLHLLNVVFVFLVVAKLTGKKEAAIIVSLFFAVHPLHVESVAWIAERKDVLYTFFYLSAWLAYITYLKSENVKGWKSGYLVFSLLLFACSLLSKSMAVTLPLILILTDYYLEKKINLKSLLEKIPFFLLSLIFGVVALKSQGTSGATEAAPYFPFWERILLSAYGLVFYILKLFVPVHLSAFHPYPNNDEPLPVIFYLAPLILLLLAFLIYKSKGFKKELIFGLLFFIVAVAPVIQLLPAGKALTAERYSYVPSIGLFFIVALFYSFVTQKLKPLLAIAIGVYAVVFSIITYQRIDKWKNGIILFTDIIEKYPDSKGIDFAWYNRGLTKNNMGNYKGAIEDYDGAIKINPKYVQAWYNRGFSKGMYQDFSGAITDFNEAIQLYPSHYQAYNNRGNAKGMLGDYKNALTDFTEALRIKPDYSEAFFNRGVTKLRFGLTPDACDDWHKAIGLGYDKAGEMIQKFCK